MNKQLKKQTIVTLFSFLSALLQLSLAQDGLVRGLFLKIQIQTQMLAK